MFTTKARRHKEPRRRARELSQGNLISCVRKGISAVQADVDKGRAPITRNLPYSWYSSPNRHVLSIEDFRRFCTTHNIEVKKQIPLSSRGTVWTARLWPNLCADEAVFVISARP